jgi:hypothetical protein
MYDNMGQDNRERKGVKTYVPAYQKEIWSEHADKLDMSQSEFVRTMVQAGRKKFEFSSPESGDNATKNVKEQIVQVLRQHGPLDWDELIEELTRDLEQDIEKKLEELQDSNEIRYSGKNGGYLLRDD